MSSDPSLLANHLRRYGVQPAAAIRRALGLTQPTFSRALARTDGLIRIGRARAARYGLSRSVANRGSHWPVYRLDARGAPRRVGLLHAVHVDCWWFEPSKRACRWLHGASSDGLFRGLPWFLADLRPQGFMGRAFGRRHGVDLGLPNDASRWTDDDVLLALLSRGEDLPGDFIVGEAALERVQRLRLAAPDAISRRARAKRYGELAAAAVAGELVGSSAGGEQPKFGATIADGNRSVRHVLVKFSDMVASAAGRRWADLLVCEHVAGEILRHARIASARSEIVDSGGRRCLEVSRFDRVGAHGRRGFVSLAALDANEYGMHDDWRHAADRLERDGWIGAAGAQSLRTLRFFGQLIGNTDQHFGNVGFEFGEVRPFRLAPAYDMLPMLYRPAAAGEIVARRLEPELPPPEATAAWERGAALALVFWRRVAKDARISRDFRTIALQNATSVARVRSTHRRGR